MFSIDGVLWRGVRARWGTFKSSGSTRNEPKVKGAIKHVMIMTQCSAEVVAWINESSKTCGLSVDDLPQCSSARPMFSLGW